MLTLDSPLVRPFIGKSPQIRHVVNRIEQMSDQRWPVLILGETGTGKELIARMIHQRGNQGPFVVVDCSSIPPALMESELFGHAKGAFTGAMFAKTGLIEQANGGTAFFDEMGELPLEVQAKLLRVLQEKEFRPVGATHSRRSDFRVIAATHRDLAAEADKGTFRRDLFYRLKVITLRLPALRERPEDIPDLIEHFLRKYGMASAISPEAMNALMAYEWPGNVRELENCIQHMVAVNRGQVLQVADMPSTFISRAVIAQSPLLNLANATGTCLSPSPTAALAPGLDDEDGPVIPLDALERREILKAIRRTKGDRTAAATLLGIGRTTLYRKLKEYGFAD
ncbi:MAG TPA: sigma-54 dependent transcriptional regulator [Bryobacteraceae bacterium]|nr:sigma-54 dependent transcriptional regulator [Bryobacteraceae bacterium]